MFSLGKKSGKGVEENVLVVKDSKDDKLPPIPGAESRPNDSVEKDEEGKQSLPQILSDDENDKSTKGIDSAESKTEVTENKPSAYIKPANYDCWVRAMDVNGLVYYYNTKSGESTWLAPCVVCYKNGERFCLKCAMPFCDKHFQKKHKSIENAQEHVWSTQEQQTQREEMTNPEEQEYCVECQLKIATRLCLECWDPYCQRCFELVHHVGNLKTHPVMTYSRGHEGWFTVRRYDIANNGDSANMQQALVSVATAADGGSFISTGTSHKFGQSTKGNEPPKNASNKPGVMEYYVHGGTKEVTYEKPVELMSDLEKVLYHNWKHHQSAAEQYVQQLEEMQYELEKAKYERDKLLVENAQISQGMLPMSSTKKGKLTTPGNGGGSTSSPRTGFTSGKTTPVLDKLIEVESDDYRQKLLHPTDRKRGEARATYMKNLLEEPLPK